MSKKNGKALLEKVQSYGKFDTPSYEIVDGTVSGTLSTALDASYLYRLKAYEADSWVKIGASPSPASEEGLLMTQYDELTIEVNDGDKVGVIGGKVNIVPLS
jgi:hypothetical protein